MDRVGANAQARVADLGLRNDAVAMGDGPVEQQLATRATADEVISTFLEPGGRILGIIFKPLILKNN